MTVFGMVLTERGSCTVKDIINEYTCIQLLKGLISQQMEYFKQRNSKTRCWSWHCSFDTMQYSRQAPAFLKTPVALSSRMFLLR